MGRCHKTSFKKMSDCNIIYSRFCKKKKPQHISHMLSSQRGSPEGFCQLPMGFISPGDRGMGDSEKRQSQWCEVGHSHPHARQPVCELLDCVCGWPFLRDPMAQEHTGGLGQGQCLLSLQGQGLDWPKTPTEATLNRNRLVFPPKTPEAAAKCRTLYSSRLPPHSEPHHCVLSKETPRWYSCVQGAH